MEDEAPEWLANAGPRLRQMYAYWQGKCQGGKLPRRADIDPIDIPRLLPNLIIVDVVPDARRYVYRLVGTKEVQIRGNDPTGKTVTEAFFGPSLEDALGWYDGAVSTLRPQYDSSPYVSTNGRWVNDETVFLPLSDDGISVNRVLVFAATSPSQPKRAPSKLPIK